MTEFTITVEARCAGMVVSNNTMRTLEHNLAREQASLVTQRAVSLIAEGVIIELIAILAVKDIAAAIATINQGTKTQMVRWPLEITVANGYGAERTFDFAELYEKVKDRELSSFSIQSPRSDG